MKELTRLERLKQIQLALTHAYATTDRINTAIRREPDDTAKLERARVLVKTNLDSFAEELHYMNEEAKHVAT